MTNTPQWFHRVTPNRQVKTITYRIELEPVMIKRFERIAKFLGRGRIDCAAEAIQDWVEKQKNKLRK